MPKCDSLLKSSMGPLADGHHVILPLSCAAAGRDGLRFHGWKQKRAMNSRNNVGRFVYACTTFEGKLLHPKAEKLKDRAGQIDLVKQATQLA